ncbi:hypothetical protein Tco_1114935 [Tanacetum coccineum]
MVGAMVGISLDSIGECWVSNGYNAVHNVGNSGCSRCRGLGHLARNYTVRPRRRDAAYLQTQLVIAQKEEAGIQLQAEDFDLMQLQAELR